MTYDFDRLVDRRNTDSSKWQKYGPDVLPLWVADMDFQSPEPVIRALRERVEHGVFGYLAFEQPEFQLVRWISADDRKKLEDFVQANYSSCAEDLDNDKVFVARNQFILDYTRERAPGISFADIKDVKDKAI